MSLFTGSGTAIVTPFQANGEVNYSKLEEMIDWQIKNKTDAIIVCGTTGEAAAMNDAEHLDCIRGYFGRRRPGPGDCRNRL